MLLSLPRRPPSLSYSYFNRSTQPWREEGRMWGTWTVEEKTSSKGLCKNRSGSLVTWPGPAWPGPTGRSLEGDWAHDRDIVGPKAAQMFRAPPLPAQMARSHWGVQECGPRALCSQPGGQFPTGETGGDLEVLWATGGHQVSDRWSQTKPGFSYLGPGVLTRREFRARTLTRREHLLVNYRGRESNS